MWPVPALNSKLDSGLPLPVLIVPEGELGILINAQSIWSGQSFKSLIDEISKDKDASIEVQDHNISSLERFTTTKACRVVRARFDLALEDRGCPWNCLEIEDRLSGFKGPKFLENGASLQKWQLTNPKITSMNRSEYAPVQGAKSLDKWLLISEKNSCSTAHVDIGVATWLSCLAGKKTFWVRNTSVDDQEVWSDFDVDDDHRQFSEPWARIDLYPGFALLVYQPLYYTFS